MSFSSADQNRVASEEIPVQTIASRAPIEMTDIPWEETRDGIDSLPRELWDMIVLHFLVVDDVPRHITKTHKPPIQLQLDPILRNGLLPAYYALHRVWTFDNEDTIKGLLPAWVRALPPHIFSRLNRPLLTGLGGLRVAYNDDQDVLAFRVTKTEPKDLFSMLGFWVIDRHRARIV